MYYVIGTLKKKRKHIYTRSSIRCESRYVILIQNYRVTRTYEIMCEHVVVIGGFPTTVRDVTVPAAVLMLTLLTTSSHQFMCFMPLLLITYY